MRALEFTSGHSLAGLSILAAFGVMAVWQSLFPRITSSKENDQ